MNKLHIKQKRNFSPWQKNRFCSMAYEIIAVIAIILFISIGLLWQFSSVFAFKVPRPDISKDFALVILQIQVTVDTLTISIIALMSGNISDSNMGIPLSDYYLNIRPCIFKQKRIILGSLFLLAANTGGYTAGWYYIIFWVFAITLVLVSVSVNEIYLLFRGKTVAEYEIKDNIFHVLQKEMVFSQKFNVCQAFLNDWKSIAPSHSKEDFILYETVFLDEISALLDYKTPESLNGIKELCKNIEYCFFKCRKKRCQRKWYYSSE